MFSLCDCSHKNLTTGNNICTEFKHIYPKLVTSERRKRKPTTTHLGYRDEDASARRRVLVKQGSGDQADQPDHHGTSGHAESNVHPGVCLDPDEDGEGDELPGAEGEVSGVEVGREPPGLLGVLPPELVSPMGDDVGLQAATPKRHQAEGHIEYESPVASCLLTMLGPLGIIHVASWWPQWLEMCLDGQ